MGLAREPKKGVLCGAGSEEYEESDRKDINHLARSPAYLVAKVYESWVVVDGYEICCEGSEGRVRSVNPDFYGGNCQSRTAPGVCNGAIQVETDFLKFVDDAPTALF